MALPSHGGAIQEWMEHMLVLLLLAISLSIDAFAVSFAYGIKSTRIPLASKLIVCLFSIIYFGLAVFFGNFISGFLSPRVAGIIGIVFMAAVFVFMLMQIFHPKDEKPAKKPKEPKTLLDFTLRSFGITLTVIRDPLLCDIDKSSSISIGEAFFLGIALSVDSIAVGIGFSLSYHVNLFGVLLVGLVQLLFLSAGNLIGLHLNKISMKHSDKLQIISCVIMFVIIMIRIFSL